MIKALKRFVVGPNPHGKKKETLSNNKKESILKGSAVSRQQKLTNGPINVPRQKGSQIELGPDCLRSGVGDRLHGKEGCRLPSYRLPVEREKIK
ncbi:hypothetical protein CEXT_351361 [Caerostris extrusa]|uniref:Ribosomal protein S12 n=1 Tax=Caerostris extrusa TaxID=172846 RepID=A0AAV4RL33_CAEEX|nr:hypothetical protein CEXT_351361 [Caerostris extrusa]